MKGNHIATTLILLFINFLQIILSQTEDDSLQPPETTQQSFEILENLEQTRTVKLYWKSNSSTANNTFLIELFTNDDFVAKFTTENTSLTLDELSIHRCEFRIYSQNFLGDISKNYSLIIVPQRRLIYSLATNIVVQKIPESNSYEITWDYFLKNPRYVNCSVFWISEQSSSFTWRYTKVNRTIVSLADGDLNSYRFGVSVNSKDTSSGIVWSHCDTELPIGELSYVQAIKGDARSILVYWEFYCKPQAQLVNQFTLTYCLVGHCASSFKKIELINQSISNKHEIVLRQLNPNSTYYIEFSSPLIRKKYELYGLTAQFVFPVPPSPEQFEIFYKTNQSNPILQWKFKSEYTQSFVLKILEADSPLLRYSRRIPLDYCDFMALKCVYDFNNSKIFLKPFTNYRFFTYSCNENDDCSNETVHNYSTPMTAPGKINVVFLEKLSDVKYRVNLQKPNEPNGPISLYHVQQSNLVKIENFIFSGNQNYTDVEVKCSPRSEKNQSKGEEFEISIAASNRLDDSTELIGPYSEPLKIELCIDFDLKTNAPTKSDIKTILPIIMSILSGILIIIILTFVAYKTFIRYKVRKETLVIKVQCNNGDDPERGFSDNNNNNQAPTDGDTSDQVNVNFTELKLYYNVTDKKTDRTTKKALKIVQANADKPVKGSHFQPPPPPLHKSDDQISKSTESTEITDDCSIAESISENNEESLDNVEQNKTDTFIDNKYLDTDFTDDYLEDFYVDEENEQNFETSFNTKDKFQYVKPKNE